MLVVYGYKDEWSYVDEITQNLVQPLLEFLIGSQFKLEISQNLPSHWICFLDEIKCRIFFVGCSALKKYH